MKQFMNFFFALFLIINLSAAEEYFSGLTSLYFSEVQLQQVRTNLNKIKEIAQNQESKELFEKIENSFNQLYSENEMDIYNLLFFFDSLEADSNYIIYAKNAKNIIEACLLNRSENHLEKPTLKRSSRSHNLILQAQFESSYIDGFEMIEKFEDYCMPKFHYKDYNSKNFNKNFMQHLLYKKILNKLSFYLKSAKDKVQDDLELTDILDDLINRIDYFNHLNFKENIGDNFKDMLSICEVFQENQMIQDQMLNSINIIKFLMINSNQVFNNIIEYTGFLDISISDNFKKKNS